MSGHTPGPWGVDKNITETLWFVTAPESSRCRGYISTLATTNKDSESNARLIAAAPDMYEALTAPERIERDSNGNIVLRINEEFYDRMIAKAEGRA